MMVTARGRTVSVPSTASSPVILQRSWITPNSRCSISSLVFFRINVKLHSKLSRTFWNLMKLLSLVRRAECLNCAAHYLLIHNNGLLSGWRASLRKAFIHSWRKWFCFSELWLQYLYQAPICSSAQECFCRMLEMCFGRTRPSRFQAQGQSKVTASCNFCVVDGLVQPYPLYIKGQLCALRPDSSLMYTFVWLVTHWWSWVQLVFSLCSNRQGRE